MHGKAHPPRKIERETNATLLRQAAMRIVDRRTIAQGELDFPCVPALADAYVSKMGNLWKGLARPFSEREVTQLREHVTRALNTGYEASPFARMVVSYIARPPPQNDLVYNIGLKEPTMAEHYASWTHRREPPLFGEWPDAKVLVVARGLGDPKDTPVLDVGAGTGRNAIPLARRGHPTDAVEPVPALVREMRREAGAANVKIGIIEGDVLSTDVSLASEHYKLVVLSEVMTHFRSVGEVRTAFQKFASALAPGGLVVLNAFLPVGGYKPDNAVRQLSQTAWSCLFTLAELEFITEELPFDKVSDEVAYVFEKANHPESQWPPTEWFESWSRGQNVFDLPADRVPIELRWLVYKKRA
jgi:2-polyprenyl-3-methyl-5-hydroxy-6-metoxy-1,4-benzoquinol methylase